MLSKTISCVGSQYTDLMLHKLSRNDVKDFSLLQNKFSLLNLGKDDVSFDANRHEVKKLS